MTSEPALRVIMRRLREIMSEPGDGQARLDKIVKQIAGVMVTEVCSIYLKRQEGSLELFATEGLKPGAVHNDPHEARRGPRRPLRRAQHHRQRARGLEPPGVLLPAGDGRGDLPFAARRADPALGPGAGRARGAEPHARRNTPTRTWRCCRRPRCSSPSISSPARSRAPAPRSSSASRSPRSSRASRSRQGIALGHVVLHEPRIVVTKLMAEDTGGGARAARHGDRHAAEPRSTRCSTTSTWPAPASTATCSRPTACSPTTRAGSGGCARRSRAATAEAAVERVQNSHARAHAAPERCLLARAPARPRRPLRPAAAHPRRAHHQRGRALAAAARYHPRCAHHGAGGAPRLRPQAAARARRRGRQRAEPRGDRRQGAGHRRGGAGGRHRRARQRRRCGDRRRDRPARCTCAPPPT